MDASAVRRVATNLAAIDWDWRKPRKGLVAAGWTCVEEGDERTDWRHDDGTRANVWFHDGTCIGVEVRLAVDYPDEDADAAELDEVYRETTGLYRTVTEAVTAELGPPSFDDRPSAPGFPADQDALRCAMWPQSSARVMVQIQHPRPDFPVELCVVVAPHV